MTRLQILSVAVAALLMLAPEAMARGGGAARGGVRGAAVGGMVGGSSGAKTGAKIGVVAGATRGVTGRVADRNQMTTETQSRTQYESTTEYQSAPQSNFEQAPPDVVATSATAATAAPGGEVILRNDAKPILGVTFPSDWTQKAADKSVTAVSGDKHAWSAVGILEGIKDKQAGIDRIKQGLEKSLTSIDYDDPTETERGTLMVTGTGKTKKAGVDVVFATGVFEPAPGQFAAAAFVVDNNLDDQYKETVRYICETMRGAEDLPQ
jgi:uncharacterized protein YcfJ